MEVEGIHLKRFPNKGMFPRAKNSVQMKSTGDARPFRLSKLFGGQGRGSNCRYADFQICVSELYGVLGGGVRCSDSRKLGYPPVRNWPLEASRVIAAWDTGKRALQKRQKTSVCTQNCTQNALQEHYIVHSLDAVLVKCPNLLRKMWSRRQDLNLRPDDYKSLEYVIRIPAKS